MSVRTENSKTANGADHQFINSPQVSMGDVEKLTHDVGERLGAIGSKISDSSAEYLKSGRDYVKENPVKGLAYAASAGAIFGAIMTLLMRRK